MVSLRSVLRPACLALLLAGCGDFPEVEAAAREKITAPAMPPRITPIDAIRDQAATITITDADTAALEERAMTLRSRVEGLEAQAADPATVARLTAAATAP
jgi:hypothetical protein